MATSKAAWRAYSQCAEPRTSSQWVWLGRTTPMWWELHWEAAYPPEPFRSPHNAWVNSPPVQLSFVDHAYRALYGGDDWATLAWEGEAHLTNYTVRCVLQQWQDAGSTRSVMTLCDSQTCYIWSGQIAASQFDARCGFIPHPSWGVGTRTGSDVACTPGFGATALNIDAVRPAWAPAKPGLDLTGGTALTSLALKWPPV